MHAQSTVRNKSLQTLAFIFHVGLSLPISMYVYLHQIQNFLRRAFRLEKSSIILLTSSFRASAFSTDKTARPLNLSSCIMFRRYFLINFNLENDLSVVADLEVSDTCVRSSLLSWVELWNMESKMRNAKCRTTVISWQVRSHDCSYYTVYCTSCSAGAVVNCIIQMWKVASCCRRCWLSARWKDDDQIVVSMMTSMVRHSRHNGVTMTILTARRWPV